MMTVKTKKVNSVKPVKKNSLVENINAKKKAGTSNTKSKSTVSKKNYTNMKNGWKKSDS